jgi:hypothetical protein
VKWLTKDWYQELEKLAGKIKMNYKLAKGSISEYSLKTIAAN